MITAIAIRGVIDRYHIAGHHCAAAGMEGARPRSREETSEDRSGSRRARGPALPPGLATGQPQTVIDVKSLKKKTRPPKRFTEATLLTAMETAGKTLDEKELSEAMKETGLGTPATRAAIIEVLLKREYIVRKGKSLEATDKGIRLIEVVHPEVKSPAMTGQWEAYLKRIQRGEAQLEPFMEGIEEYVREVVSKVGQTRTAARLHGRCSRKSQTAPASLKAPMTQRPPIGRDIAELLHERVRLLLLSAQPGSRLPGGDRGRDVLLVMPTGSGKSLCYQLPGIARGGTTLVISPLIALMEDQVAKLKELGFAVSASTPARPRPHSRQACLDYLSGKLQFLFIAPERLRVPGFPEMLAKRKPTLIAIDEAHCISQWGHDFRPDYRMLGQYCPAAPGAGDGADRDGHAHRAGRHRRAVGLRNRPAFHPRLPPRQHRRSRSSKSRPSQRAELARELLGDREHRPAIVYAPTRKQAEALAVELARACSRGRLPRRARCPSAASECRRSFFTGRIEVMVATIAFGMGIDKADVRTVIHTALPGSLEGYYQEIGRAGRDGKPSRAILMHSYADRYTHDFFFERDYPDSDVLERSSAGFGPNLKKRPRSSSNSGWPRGVFDKALEKLWTHGGAVVDFAENVSRGHDQWRESYIAHGEQAGTNRA